MVIGWKRHYHLDSEHCETSGWTPIPQHDFVSYLVEVVRPEWHRWITIDPSLVQSLVQTGFSSSAIEALTKVNAVNYSETTLQGDFGEVLSTVFLASQRGMSFPWPTFWDRRVPKASLGGGDIVGFAYDRQGAFFVVGQAKASSETRQPPTVVTHPKNGLVAQLMLLYDTRELVVAHLRWLLVRSKGEKWEQDLIQAMTRFFEDSTRVIVGVLVRDCYPAPLDLEIAHNKFKPDSGPKVQLFGCYLPMGLTECVKISIPSSSQGGMNAN
jgi:hypothetical protein